VNTAKQTTYYVISDILSAAIAWFLLFWFRKTYIDTAHIDYQIPFEQDAKLKLGMVVIPLFWITIYYFSGFYRNIFRRSRLRKRYTLLFWAP